MKQWIGLALAAVMVAGCDFEMHGFGGPQVVGSGKAGTLSRKVGSFKSVALDGSMDADITIAKASDIEITGDDNLIKLVKTEIRGDTLHIYVDGSYTTKHPLKATFSVPALEAASISGSGDLNLHSYRGSSLKLSIAGSGDLKADGATDRLDARIAGSGDLNLYGLKAANAKVSVSGSGDVQLTVTGNLAASVAGSGDVHYRGRPTHVDKSVAGSGEVSSGE
ncbi:MAG: head GIN domain-containing protein [Fimbriimonadales bacterium]